MNNTEEFSQSDPWSHTFDTTSQSSPFAPYEAYDPSTNPLYESSLEEKTMHQRKKRKTMIGLSIFVLIFVVVIAAATSYYFYYRHRALPGITVAHQSVSGKTAAQIESFIAHRQKNVTATFTGDVSSPQHARLSDLGIKIDEQKTALQAVRAHHHFLSYFTAPFTTHNITPIKTYDTTDLARYTTLLSAKVPRTSQPSEPQVLLSANKEDFQIKPGKSGMGISYRVVRATGNKLADTLQPVSQKVHIENIKPLFTVEQLQPILQRAQKLASTPVTIQAGNHRLQPDKKTRASWVDLPEILSKKAPTINRDKVDKWVSQQAAAINVKPVNGKQYVTQSGKVLASQPAPKDGRQVTNTASISSTLIKSLDNVQPFDQSFAIQTIKAQPEKKTVADGTQNLAYWAGVDEKWIDINLSKNTVTMYVGATVKGGPFPVVPGATQTPTVVGTFHIQGKYRSQTMRGHNVDGSPYTTPNVPWVSYFHGGYALHGAPWRSEFGAGVPRSNGSHGCVNMRIPDAETIYNFAPAGTTVVSHY